MEQSKIIDTLETYQRPGGLCSPLSTPRCFFGPLDVFWSKKIHKKFRCVWTPFGIDFL